jgi:hypothetical protein
MTTQPKKVMGIEKPVQIVKNGTMVTASGQIVYLLNPDPATINIEDIAHGLANNSRWNGHTKAYWSVAQHCCMMHDFAPKGEELTYLLHDAEEAYWGDMIKPLKNIIFELAPEIIRYMNNMRDIIFMKYGIQEMTEDVKRMDVKLLAWEYENLIERLQFNPIWDPSIAKIEWLHRYYNAKHGADYVLTNLKDLWTNAQK